MRASIYNAMPTEGVEKLCDFIKAFDKNNLIVGADIIRPALSVGIAGQ